MEKVIDKKLNQNKKEGKKSNKIECQCPIAKKCGGCNGIRGDYKHSLASKEKMVRELMEPFCKVYPITGMENPYHYRNKVHAAFDRKKDGTIVSGIYEEKTHQVVNVDNCLIEDEIADAIIVDIRNMLKSFKIKTYDEDSGYGLLRHVLVRRGFATGQVMVVLVCGSPVFPSKNNFVKVLRKLHPEISTVILNVNDKKTSMVLGQRNITIYGKGFIEDVLCGVKFRISPSSFYQVNPVQTEKLYDKAIRLAGLKGRENVLDAYSGIGTIGLIASKHAKQVTGVELNAQAVKDAIGNAKGNQITNARFYAGDAGDFMVAQAAEGIKYDVVFMDPPRSGSSDAFLNSIVTASPNKIVYISCNPETLARDVAKLEKKGYEAFGAWPFDMFSWTEHVETVVLMQMKKRGDYYEK